MFLDRKHVISNAAAHVSDVPSPGDLIARYQTAGRHVVLYTGTFEPYQGLALVVDAAPTVLKGEPDTVFLCIGGHTPQIAELRRQACDHGVEHAFRFPGIMPPETMEAHFACADILLSPRISGTNTPLKIYTYLRSGVPILATNIRAHTQVLTADVALLVDPQPDTIAAGIVTLLRDGELGQRLTLNALKLAQQQFSIEAYYAKVAQVYAFLEAAGAPRAERLQRREL